MTECDLIAYNFLQFTLISTNISCIQDATSELHGVILSRPPVNPVCNVML